MPGTTQQCSDKECFCGDKKMGGSCFWHCAVMCEYSGEMRDGQRHGRGQAIYADGTEFNGEWNKGKKVHGVLNRRVNDYHPTSYTGFFLNDKFDGQGETIWHGCSMVYKGQYRNGIEHGEGTSILGADTKYEGCFHEGKRTHGITTYSDGSRFDGALNSGGQHHGRGIFFHANGVVCKCTWRHGQRQGNGTETYPCGHTFEINFRNNEYNGNGKIIFPSHGGSGALPYKPLRTAPGSLDVEAAVQSALDVRARADAAAAELLAAEGEQTSTPSTRRNRRNGRGRRSLPSPESLPQAVEPPQHCVVCLAESKDTVFLPCRHACCCATCAITVMASAPRRCPLCRSEIEDSIKVYF